MVRNIDRQISLSRVLRSEIAFPIVLGLGLRMALSLWVALVWARVDPYFNLEKNWAWLRGAYSGVPAEPTLLGRMLTDAWVHWDAAHFLAIAKYGYVQLEPGNMNFFPLYPWFVRTAQVFALNNIKIAGLLISTIFAILAFILFQRFTWYTWQDPQLARWSVVVWAIYPTSFFFFAPYSEGLYLSFVLGCFICLKEERWLIAGFLACLACLTRAQGILLLFPMAYGVIRYIASRGIKASATALLSLLIVPVGWLGYMGWRMQQDQSGLFASYSQFSKITFADPLSAFFHAMAQLFETRNPHLAADLISIVLFGCLLIAMILQKKFRAQTGLLIYSAVTLAAFLPWKSDLVSPYQSATRYVLGLFPLFVVLANWLRSRSIHLRLLYIAASATLLLITSALYTLWFFVG